MSGELPLGGVHAVIPRHTGTTANAAGSTPSPASGVPGHEGFRPRHAPRGEGGGGDPGNAAKSRMYRTTALFPEVPQKIVVEDHSLVDVFRQSASFQKIVCYLQGCAESIFSTPFSLKKRAEIVDALKTQVRQENKKGSAGAEEDEEESAAGATATPSLGPWKVSGEDDSFAPTVTFFLTELFPFLNWLVDEIPLEDMAQQRFGNRAKRTFHARMEEVIVEWMRRLVDTLPPYAGRDMTPYTYDASTHGFTRSTQAARPRTEAEKQRLAVELAEYVKDSFGNATRLDFGTGHELHFFLVIMTCLEELGDKGGTLLTNAEEREKNVFVPLSVPRPAPVPENCLAHVKTLRRQMVLFVFEEYLSFARRLQHHYGLEPAGSHGVWGLDDYHHIPYIFGAAQLIGKERPHPSTAAVPPPPVKITANASSTEGSSTASTAAATGAGHDVVLTKYVCDKAKVRELADEYMYFHMIQWILENKQGPFFEHSNMLYNISAVELWFKTYGGMIKMYAAEVLSKFNVVQHLLFGMHLPWNTQSLDVQPEDVAPAEECRKKTEPEHFL